MPTIIDAETMNVDDLPGIWSPVQWELEEEERIQELEDQATASLIWTIDTPEAILRLLLNEVSIERAFVPPEGFDPEQQGEWDQNMLTFQFKRPIRMEKVERKRDYLYVEYDFGDFGYWAFEIRPEEVKISRL